MIDWSRCEPGARDLPRDSPTQTPILVRLVIALSSHIGVTARRRRCRGRAAAGARGHRRLPTQRGTQSVQSTDTSEFARILCI